MAFNLLDREFLRCYYKEKSKGRSSQFETEVISFYSTTATDPKSDDVPDRYDGYFVDDGGKEIEKLGDAVQISTGSENIYTSPYGSKLRPLNDYSALKTASHVLLNAVKFEAYDVTRGGSSDQDSDAENAMTESLNNDFDALVSTPDFNTIPVPWAHNYFRPKIKLDNYNVFHSMDKTFFKNSNGANHKGDLALGYPLPFEQQVQIERPSVGNIEINAICGQYMEDPTSGNNFIKRYPLRCELLFTYQKS